jgi:hypothetical protein
MSRPRSISKCSIRSTNSGRSRNSRSWQCSAARSFWPASGSVPPRPLRARARSFVCAAGDGRGARPRGRSAQGAQPARLAAHHPRLRALVSRGARADRRLWTAARNFGRLAIVAFLQLLAGQFATLSVFSVLAGALYERRHELGLEAWHAPERKQERDAATRNAGRASERSTPPMTRCASALTATPGRSCRIGSRARQRGRRLPLAMRAARELGRCALRHPHDRGDA